MSTKKTSTRSSAYHHGDLRQALLQSAERILRRDGLQGLSLRAVARETGVTHAAPAHHFPNLASLLSELAAVGFERLAASLREASANPKAEAADAGRAYVRFARENQAMFFLMSDPSRLDPKNAVLQAARQKALVALAGTGPVSIETPTLAQLGHITANWALVHGFSMLMLTGRLASLLRIAPSGTTETDLLDAMLSSMEQD